MSRSTEYRAAMAAANGFSEVPKFKQPESKPRMTEEQVIAMWRLCGRYNVPFREDDYYPGTGDGLPDGYFAGWVGGWKPGSDRKKTIYVGVSPDGYVSS